MNNFISPASPAWVRRLCVAALLVGATACQPSTDELPELLDAELPESLDEELPPRQEAAELFDGEQGLVVVTGEDESAKDLLVWQHGGAVRPNPPEVLGPRVEAALSAGQREEPLQVDVFLEEPPSTFAEPLASASGQLDARGRLLGLTFDGRPASLADLEAHQDRLAQGLRDAETARRDHYRAQWEALAARHGLRAQLDRAITAGAGSAVLTAPARVFEQIEAERAVAPVRRIAAHRDPEGADGIASALASVEVGSHAIPSGWRGDGIGVWMNDGNGKPMTWTSCVDPSDVTVQDYGSEPFETHATQTLCTLQAAAPGAQVHYAVPTQACNLRSDVASFTNPPVLVSSQSNSFGDDGTDYSTCSRDWDDFVYDTRIAHFALAQNQDSNVRGAAKAYNVFSIGAYDHGASPDVMAEFSNWGDPATGANKPEFVAPGVGIDLNPYADLSGTSFSTPIAAGFAADLLERHSFLRLQPALLKAFLLVNSVRISGSSPFGYDDGAGRLDFSNTAYGKWWWWSGTNGSWFNQETDGDGRLERNVAYTLWAGQTYYVALSWLVDGGYVHDHGKPNMDLDLRIISPNGAKWTSWSVDDNYEMVKLTAPVTGTYTLQIERYWNSGQGDVIMGLVVRSR